MADDSLMIHMAAVKFLDAKKYESHSEGFCISPVTKDELALIFCVNGEASIAEHRVLIGKQQVFLPAFGNRFMYMTMHSATP